MKSNKMKLMAVGVASFLMAACGEYKEVEKPAYTLHESILLSRDEAANLQVSFNDSIEYSLYKTGASGQIGEQVAVSEQGVLQGTFTDPRTVFAAISKEDTLFVSERHIQLEGAHNFRDIGGIRTTEGYQVKWGVIYRSDKLSELTENDFSKLAKLNVQTICDFRSGVEVSEEPDTWPNLEQVNAVSLPIGDSTMTDKKEMLANLRSGNFDADSMMYEANRGFVLTYADKYKKFFSVLLEDQSYPLLFHCTGGKDRTGLASALILSAVGVDRETITSEYLMTNYFTYGKTEDMLKKAALLYGIDSDVLRKMMGVKREFIQGAYDAIAEKYGTVDNFLEQELGVGAREKELLKEKLLYGYQSVAIETEVVAKQTEL
ncbi:tyrosine-protein phosphatase [Limibacter armeniacum]|uniref:tyrosine-protein phosphatase n=1 Tax=Limibacter armeniacum TaxID=466084 RepID=UPI002FE61FF0